MMKSTKVIRLFARLGVSSAAMVAAISTGQAQCVVDAEGICRINNTGLISPTLQITQPTVVTNTGTIGAITQTATQPTLIDNKAGGTIASITTSAVNTAPASGLHGTTIINAGGIAGNVTLNNSNARGFTTYVANGGAIGGALTQPGFGSLVFIDGGRGTTGIGSLDAGLGLDIYIKSFDASGSYTLGTALPTTFEVPGVDARGTSTVITLVSSDPTTVHEGMVLSGSGSIVNQGKIAPISLEGFGIPLGPQPQLSALVYNSGENDRVHVLSYTSPPTSITHGSALTRFSNDGEVTGDIRIATANFTNSGTINLITNSQLGSVLRAAKEQPFTFTNSGEILTTETGTRSTTGLTEQFYDNIHSNFRIRNAIDATSTQDATITNTGTISGGIDVELLAKNFTFDNSGTIGSIASPFGGRAPAVEIGLNSDLILIDPVLLELDQLPRADTVNIRNSGTINGNIDVYADATRSSFENTGVIAGSFYLAGDDFDSSAAPAESFTATNSNRIEALSGDFSTAFYTETNARNVSLSNSGTISVVQDTTKARNPYANHSAAYLSNEADGTSSITVTNTGTILSGVTGTSGLVLEGYAGFEGTPPSSPSISIVNSGRIAATDGTFLNQIPGEFNPTTGMSGPARNEVVLATGLAAAALGTGGGVSSISIVNEAAGTIEATGFLRRGHSLFTPVAGFPAFTAAPLGAGMIALAASADTVLITNHGTITGSAGGVLAPTTVISINGEAFPELTPITGYLAGAIQTLASKDTVTNSATGIIVGSIDLGAFDDSLENRGTIAGDIFLRDGNDSLLHSLAGSFAGIADGGAGTDALIVDLAGQSLNDTLLAQFINFESTAFTGSGTVVGTAAAALTTVNVASGTLNIAEGATLDTAGDTAITGSDSGAEAVANTGMVVGNVALNGGDDSVNNGGTVAGSIALGGGVDSLVNTGSITGDIATGAGGDIVRLNAGSIAGLDTGEGNDDVINSAAINGNLAGGLGDEAVNNSGSIAGMVDLGDGADVFANSGSVTGPVSLGAGSDTLIIQRGSTFAAGVDAGAADNDRLVLQTAGTETAPHDAGLSAYGGFEQLDSQSGVNSYSGAASYGSVSISGGRLIGQAGSVLSGGSITVATDATFGSSGTVVGNVIVNGTLAPGSSPGTMTVTGNVSLATGSTSLFELTPTLSDQLLISGTLSIASGATLALTGDRPLTPGSALDLIVADGGITGTFANITKPASILGFVAQRGNRIQLLGQFAVEAGFNPQVAATVNYVNSALVAGSRTTALIAALPSLLTNAGTTNGLAFAQLNPEAYASAGQMGVETGLAVSNALRSDSLGWSSDRAGPFVIGQAFGNWRKLPGSTGQGTSRANVNSEGVLSGLGYGFAGGAVGAFVGYSKSSQSIGALGAKNGVDGMVAGITARVATGRFGLSAMVAKDFGKAETSRAVPGNAVANSAYRLRSMTIDAVASYAMPLSDAWSLSPQAGITHVSSKRSAVTETGAGAFNLAVLGENQKATFVDGAVAVKGKLARVSPWASIGVRHQTSGNTSAATGGLAGLPTTFTIAGVERKDTRITAGVGASVQASKGVELFLGYNGEFGGGSGHNATGGVRIRF